MGWAKDSSCHPFASPLPLQPTPSVVLVADVGGTNARFVLTDTESGTDLVTATLATAEHATLDAALSALATLPAFTPPSAAAFAGGRPRRLQRCLHDQPGLED